jgi:hypothetical protein
MFRKVSLVFLFSAVACMPCALAQKKEKLALLIQDIYGPNGLTVDSGVLTLDGSNHAAHFNSGFQSEFTQFNTALVGQLTSLPLPSPASGFTYTLDTTTGMLERTTQSFGPLLTERAETIGRNKLTFGFSYQYFRFNTIEGLDLSNVPAVFTHDDFQEGGGRSDVVTTSNSLDASIGQFTTFLTYGITDRLDVALAVPFVRTRLSLTSNATIQRIGTADQPNVHYFSDPSVPGGYGNHRQYYSSATASGLGDLIVRVKGTALRRESLRMALALDARAPTGDEKDLLGSGAAGVKPSLAMSFLVKRIAPHLNLAYQWNGKSSLAGDVRTDQKVSLPRQFLYAAGFDAGVSDKLTVAFDFLGQRVFNAPRLTQRTFVAANGSTFPDIGFRKSSFDLNSGAVGLKVNVVRRLLVNFNLAFRLNKAGLRDRVTPLVGFEYSL